MSKIIQQLEQEQLRTDIPAFAPGDTVRVNVENNFDLRYTSWGWRNAV